MQRHAKVLGEDHSSEGVSSGRDASSFLATKEPGCASQL